MRDKFRQKRIMVFDIETIPDVSVLKTLTGSDSSDLTVMRGEMEKYHRDISKGNPFLRQPFHRVVSISMLLATIVERKGHEYYRLLEIGSLPSLENSEEDLVKKFFNYLTAKVPRLVSYNGKTFDLPVLKYRAMKYAIPAEKLFKSGDRWSNYSYKYSLDWHCDLEEAFSDFGSSARCKMLEICSILGIPGKMDGMDGSRVAEVFDAGKFKEINDYCEMDVLSTYLLYLNYALLVGQIDSEGFMSMNIDLRDYLRGKNLDHLNRFLEEWEKVDSRGLFVR
jgi:predicted PolB exonuclease-like 3'-5' exonuclease